jgi:hypothetical protein
MGQLIYEKNSSGLSQAENGHVSIAPLKDGYSFVYCKNIKDASVYLELLSTKDVFFSKDFYSAVEEHVPSGTLFRYVFLLKDEQLKALFHFQIKKIDLGESLEAAYQIDQKHTLFERLSHFFKMFFARRLNYHTLVSGNMLQTGRYGLHLEKDFELNLDLYNEVLDQVTSILKNEGISVAAILAKDFYEDQKLDAVQAKKIGFHEFSVQPTMLMDIPEDWSDLEDYMNALKSKYRVRTRRTFKKCDNIEKVELDLDMLMDHQERMHEMYKNIATQASFNLFILDKLYFYSIKKHLQEKCKVIGYFCNGKMVGFYTIIYNENVVDAHFLGYDPEFNRTMHLYHNMLYDLLNEAIKNGAKKLDLSRTAMEIKSSIGAVSHKMYLYLKIRNKFLNLFTARALKFLVPEAPWEPRNPFK